jgi:hypothetical protein
MRIMVPSSTDRISLILSALTSYNHPVFLVSLFLVVFVTVLVVWKKTVKLSVYLALASTFALAIYFIISFASRVRFL